MVDAVDNKEEESLKHPKGPSGSSSSSSSSSSTTTSYKRDTDAVDAVDNNKQLMESVLHHRYAPTSHTVSSPVVPLDRSQPPYTTSFSQKTIRQNIKKIVVPPSGQFTKTEKVFNVDKTSEEYIRLLTVHGSKGHNSNLKPTKARISNSIDKKGQRWMESITDAMKSENPQLQSMTDILHWMENLTYTEGKKYTTSANLIFSKDLAYCQRAHMDFKTTDIEKARASKSALPLSAFFGICPNSSLLIWNPTTKTWQRIHYGVGDLILIAADVIHAGPTYTEDHWRIQFYMDTDIQHNPSNPNQWFDWPFEKQPIKFEIDEKVHTKDKFRETVNQTQLWNLYKVQLDDVDKFFT
jgi:hypothetical protein